MGDMAEQMKNVKGLVNLEQWCDEHLERRGPQTYVCPVCDSGNGPNHSAAFHVNGKTWHCFSCGRGGDVFDLAGLLHGTGNRTEQLKDVACWAGIELGGGRDSHDRDGRKDNQSSRTHAVRPIPDQTAGGKTAEASGAKTDYSAGRRASEAYVRECQARIGDPKAVAYLASRGMTEREAREWGLGFDPDAGGAKRADGSWAERGRIVIPWPGAPWYHIDRSIDSQAKERKYVKPRSSDVGPQPLWNADAVKEAVYWIVEGPIDALAVRACGHEAIAVCSSAMSAANLSQVADAAAASGRKGVAVVALDGDDAGRAGTAALKEALEARGVTALATDGWGESHKDAGDWLADDRARLSEALDGQEKAAKGLVAERADRAWAEALRSLNTADPAEVARGILELRDACDPIPTGFAKLDEALEGGLPARGVVTLGAISSTGKTSLALQVADQMAVAGRDVLFVTIEQSAQELVAKTISRIMSGLTRGDGSKIETSASAVLRKAEREKWADSDPDKLQALSVAVAEYERTVAPRLRLMEAVDLPAVGDIRAVAERMADHRGKPPVVFVDYLQLLASPDPHMDDKRATDANMTSLRHMARDLKTPVLVISSLNRASYSGVVSLESYKESGAIEYGSDVLLGLQPAGMESDLDGAADGKRREKARSLVADFKAERVRDCEVTVLKNRDQLVPRKGVRMRYDAMTNRFW